jgi:hypothetical protein
MGCESPVRERRSCGVMVQLSIYGNQVRDEGNCGEVTNRGKEACEDVRKRRVCDFATRTSSRQSCEATNRNRIQGRSGPVSEPNITKPSSFIRSGKSGACAAKATRLIQGSPTFVSARRACSDGRAFRGQHVSRSSEVSRGHSTGRHMPVTPGRTER